MLKRLVENKNLTQHSEPFYTYQGVNYPIQEIPMVTEYLDSTMNAIQLSLNDYSRVLAVRVDLKTTVMSDLQYGNRVMERFKKALEARIEAYLKRREKEDKPVYPCKVRMVWAREQKSSHVPHFHVLLLLNREVFYSLGSTRLGSFSLFQMIQGAWCSALRIPDEYGSGLVEKLQNDCYYLNRSDQYAQLPALFKRASYLCKVDTKCFGNGYHSFGASRQ